MLLKGLASVLQHRALLRSAIKKHGGTWPLKTVSCFGLCVTDAIWHFGIGFGLVSPKQRSWLPLAGVQNHGATWQPWRKYKY